MRYAAARGAVAVATVVATAMTTAGIAAWTAPATAATVSPRPVPPTVRSIAVPAATTATPPTGHRSAGPPMMVARLGRRVTAAFSLVGVTWARDSAASGVSVLVRVRQRGTWTRWQRLAVDPSEGPARGQEPGLRAGTTPLWVGHSTGVEARVRSDGAPPPALRVVTINPGVSPYDRAIAASTRLYAPGQPPPAAGGQPVGGRVSRSTGSVVRVPRIVTRRQWGADPSLSNRCWAPRYGSSARMVFVHHTASSNRYSEREAPAVVRSIYAYHTQAEGWCDIGYNFLVDRYGNIYEGRRGGIRKPVRGSHAGDYNVNTVGISLIGNFTSAAPTSRMKKALVRLIAWRLGSSYRYAGGWTFVNGHRFRDISGHRDAMATSCPGQVVYDWLPTLRRRVAARMGNFKTPIYAKWQALGGIGGPLGAPFVGEQWLGPGRYTVFAHGRVYWTPDTGAHALSGRILTYFRRLGGVGSVLGYPTTDVRRAAGPGTARARFAGGRLYWSRRTGAHEIYGAILKRYIHTGGAGAALGLPTTGPARVRVGWRQSFQGGRITRNSTTHRTTVRYR